jgi:hypothetical protein
MSELDKCPSKARSLAVSLFQDFRLSFRFSQGAVTLQAELFELQSAVYRKGCYGALDERLEIALPYLDRAIYSLAMPPRHKAVPKAKIIEERDSRWGELKSTIQKDKTRYGSREYKSHLVEAAAWILRRDWRYNTPDHTRPGALPEQRRDSFFRRYVLQGDRTGSPAFNRIFKDMIGTCTNDQVMEETGRLLNQWRFAHKGEPYFDKSAETHVRKTHGARTAEFLTELLIVPPIPPDR